MPGRSGSRCPPVRSRCSDPAPSPEAAALCQACCVAPGELFSLFWPVTPARGQNLGEHQEVVAGMTQVPRNLRRPIQSWDEIAACNLWSDSRKGFRRLAYGASRHVPKVGPAPDPHLWQGSPKPVAWMNWTLPLVYAGSGVPTFSASQPLTCPPLVPPTLLLSLDS